MADHVMEGRQAALIASIGAFRWLGIQRRQKHLAFRRASETLAWRPGEVINSSLLVLISTAPRRMIASMGAALSSTPPG